ncbi:MAG: recombinase family protein [Parcubacteria group bacterium]|nr:recombinase family protein [Parcubacteria group bacterium]
MEGLETTALHYVLYARKSSEAEERQALSIESQVKEISAFAEQQGLTIVEIKRESHSAKDTGQRKVFNSMIQGLRDGKYQGIVTWAPDRLSRNAGDLGALVDLMDSKKLQQIRTPSQMFTNSPSDKFLLMILCSQAKLENDNKSVNVKRGLRAKCELGVRPGVAPLGYLNNPNQTKGQRKINLDPERAHVIKEMFELVAEHGYSGRDLFVWINKETGMRTRGGKKVSLSSIYRMLNTPFYYGEFEYPRGGGVWYKGDHDPLISKELFEKVQKHLDIPTREKKRSHTFNYTRLIRCGDCGSFVSADQKIKTLKSGEQKHYIYYRCSRGRDRFCAQPPITEDDLVGEMYKVFDQIKLDEKKLTQNLKREFLKYRNFMRDVFGAEVARQSDDKLNVNAYAQYLLKTGSREEKRELLKSLETKLVLQSRCLNIP